MYLTFSYRGTLTVGFGFVAAANPYSWTAVQFLQPKSGSHAGRSPHLDHPGGLLQGTAQLFQERNQVKSESTNPGRQYTMGYPFLRAYPFLRGYTGALGRGAGKLLSSVPFCVPDVYTRYTFLQLRTFARHLAELRQLVSSDTIDTTIPHRWELPGTNPLLHGTRVDFQQLGYFLGRIDPAYFGRLWQDRRLFPRWHTQQCPFKVVSLGRTSLNLTEKLCTHEPTLNLLYIPNFRQ